MKSFKNLKIWQKSFSLVTVVYKLLEKMPKEEIYGLSSQIKRSAVSVPSNIAEGWGRGSNKSFANFLRISKASLFELETQLLLVKELKQIEIDQEIFLNNEEIGKMINGLIKKIEKTT